MMDLATIQRLSRQAAEEAAEAHKEPFIVEEGDIEAIRRSRRFPFPFVGDYLPRGWRRVRTYFVDSSGFGVKGEPALTAGQFIECLRNGYGYAVIEAGPFQVYVGEFVRTRRA